MPGGKDPFFILQGDHAGVKPKPPNKLATLLYNSPANDSGSASASPGASGARVRWSQGYPRCDKRLGSCGSNAQARGDRRPTTEGVHSLSRMTTDNAANRAKAGNAGAVEAVVVAMRT
eukprot:CAMPEP_0181377558 /NCGR_PEP_ID=MMETSP1106-20121128/17959_1 /TAXON_ID=81844 /ORGANISM="Mantoniella antarctica, Strain SL-175" /LENGTH=117 /DNA_ID=CAMNT_0023496297 /DNA_START=516 /DNA_END=867 /DNA_ORIENTATION=+